MVTANIMNLNLNVEPKKEVKSQKATDNKFENMLNAESKKLETNNSETKETKNEINKKESVKVKEEVKVEDKKVDNENVTTEKEVEVKEEIKVSDENVKIEMLSGELLTMVEEIANKLGMNTEEVVNKLQELLKENDNATEMDLFKTLKGVNNEIEVLSDIKLVEEFKELKEVLSDVKEVATESTGFKEKLFEVINEKMTVEKDANAGKEAVLRSMTGNDEITLNEKGKAKIVRVSNEETVESNQETIKDDTSNSGETKDSMFSDKEQGKENKIIKTANNANISVVNNKFENIKLNVDKVDSSQPVIKEKVVTQIIDNMKIAVSEGKTEMNMQLRPESLGKVMVKLISESGNMSAKMTVETTEAKNIIEANIIKFKENLESQGIKVNDIEVSVQTNTEQNDDMRRFNRENQSKGKRKGINKIEEIDENVDVEEYEVSSNNISVGSDNRVDYSA
ncbi:MAG: flagellar hook-length control protein FliK [Clostridia bacterium]|nr:flagellar hook-length control protein FliK [Clostridia bacterium]